MTGVNQGNGIWVTFLISECKCNECANSIEIDRDTNGDAHADVDEEQIQIHIFIYITIAHSLRLAFIKRKVSGISSIF